ncbi:single-stranded-DNA-specific exonuclease RecJ [Ectothiorhodospiraceae bacterium WFHF3C12]|nr:single-stranded-DNA-specific exonuclease RecJ [Ectothiorhodospiraceae bacterium WFHF3C12]
MKRRIVEREIPESALAALPASLHPVLRRVYAARGIRSDDELDCGASRLAPPDAFQGLEHATTLLEQALRAGWRILVVGDFDADGATSTALALRSLRAMGAAHVDYLVPNRFDFGYGLSRELVDVAVERQPDLIITVDNGISSIDGVAACQQAGIRVLVTDHHLPGERLPDADAIVNPNLPGDGFPSKNLAGVGVIFYVITALRRRLRETGYFQAAGVPEPNLAELLDLVALGTVADVVQLDGNNRVLVEQGLRRIRAGRACPGIQALLEVAGREPGAARATDLGFAIGPRLNAAGRLEDMSLGIECLLCDAMADARGMAQRLDALNRQRREIEGQMRDEAVAALEQEVDALAGESLPTGLCVFDDGWHQGVVGLLASRLRERFQRPVIAFAPDGAERLKGSARSVPGLHIRDALEAVNVSRPGVIEKFGGHAMAAGLTLHREAFARFREEFESVLETAMADVAPADVLLSDGELQPSELGLALAEAVRAGGPWGQGFPEPLFHGRFELLESRVVGERHLKMRVRPEGGDAAVDAIAFNQVDAAGASPRGRQVLAYRLDVNDYRGRRGAQLIVEYMEPDQAE